MSKLTEAQEELEYLKDVIPSRSYERISQALEEKQEPVARAKLFKHMFQEHGITLTESEMTDVIVLTGQALDKEVREECAKYINKRILDGLSVRGVAEAIREMKG